MINYARVRPPLADGRKRRAPVNKLGPRDRQLLGLLIDTTLQTKDIAHVMGVTHGTVKVYASWLYRKVGATSRVELMHWEIERLRGEVEKLTDQQEME